MLGRLRPIDKRTILFTAFNRTGLTCNPKYIMKRLISDYPGQYNIYWITRWPETVEEGPGYKVVKQRSPFFYILTAFAGMIVTNDRYDETVLKRKGQIYVNTWHGGGVFKKAAYDLVGKEAQELLITEFYSNDDYLITSNARLTQLFPKAFRMNESRILPLGMPRSDVFFDEGKRAFVREKLGISEDKKIVLYAPTHRNNLNEVRFPEKEIDKLLDVLTQRFGKDWVFAYKMHYFDEAEKYAPMKGRVYDLGGYYDTQELLCGVDILITDYSSLLWDFTLLGRPSFRYSPDIKEYLDNERDFYLEYDKWPYPHAQTPMELYDCVTTYDEELYKRKMEEFLNESGNYDDGHSAQRVAKWIADRCR